MTSTDCTVLRFSTRTLTPSRRLPAWYEIFCHSASRRYCSPADEATHVDMHIWALGQSGSWRGNNDLRVQRVATTGGLRTRRVPELLTDGNDDLVLNIQESGASHVVQCGREATAPAGAAVLSSNAETSGSRFPNRRASPASRCRAS